MEEQTRAWSINTRIEGCEEKYSTHCMLRRLKLCLLNRDMARSACLSNSQDVELIDLKSAKLLVSCLLRRCRSSNVLGLSPAKIVRFGWFLHISR